MVDLPEIRKEGKGGKTVGATAESFELILRMLMENGGSLEACNNLKLSVVELAESELCPEGLSSVPRMLRVLSQRLGELEPGCTEWWAAWAGWKEQEWSQEFPPPEKEPTHDPMNKHLAHDLQLSVRNKTNQWRLPTPTPTDITKQYRQVLQDAASAVASIAVDTGFGFIDQEFPSGVEDLRNGYSSLFVDVDNPCAEEWMSHPEAWARVEDIYPNSTVVNAVTPQPPSNLVQGGIGDSRVS